MVEVIDEVESYRIPSEELRQNRRTFYSLHRERNEEIISWLVRVQSHSSCCEFVKFANFLTIDRFIFGLEPSELNSMTSLSNIWSLNQLMTHFSNRQMRSVLTNANERIEDKISPCEDVAIAIVKCEMVR